MATLINGNLNNPVYASQDADLLASICGNKTVITPVGSQFAHELEDANTIKVDDGVIITKEGRRIQLDNGDIDEFLIPTGTQGQTQYYICGYHLYTDEESAELCETFVEAVSSGTDVIDEDTFRDGSTEVYVSLLRVKQEGVNITTITRLLSSGTDINQINVGLTQAKDDLIEIGTIISGTNSAGSPVVTRVAAQKMYITLPKGTYVVTGKLIFSDSSDNTGWRKLNITTTPNDDTPQITISSVNGAYSGLEVVAILKVTGTSATFYMNSQHSSTQNSELGIIARSLTAVKIKN